MQPTSTRGRAALRLVGLLGPVDHRQRHAHRGLLPDAERAPRRRAVVTLDSGTIVALPILEGSLSGTVDLILDVSGYLE